MNGDHERIRDATIQMLHDLGQEAGGVAVFLFMALWLLLIVFMVLLLRWIWRGGLSQTAGSGFFRRQDLSRQVISHTER